MTLRWKTVLGFVLAAALCVSIAAVSMADKDEKEEAVTIEQLPAAVQTTLQAQAAGGTILEIEKETEDGKVVYEAEISKDGKTVEVEIAEDGTLIKSEVDDEQENEDGEGDD